ncbi:unnamed protein product, partial [Didymodactylos carnosus]
ILHNVLLTLDRDPLVGLVSPSLIASSGVIPYSVISTIPDIMEHYYRVIVSAKKEVLLATNFWEKGHSVSTIGRALRDLSIKAGKENRYVIVKFIIDHPTIDNLIHFHSILPPKKWSHYDIPSPNEIPNVSLEVLNYHRLILGTFHSKFVVIDRRIALLNSNNIQDRPNLEMMSHFEGDIVNSFYDTFLISWWIPFNTYLPCINDPAPSSADFRFGDDSPTTKYIRQQMSLSVARARTLLQNHTDDDETNFIYESLDQNETKEETSESIHKVALQVIKMQNAKNDVENKHSPLTQRFNAVCKYPRSISTTITSSDLEILSIDFCPFIFHKPHKPFPIALVNRPPHGTPGHDDICVPQNAAWLGAFNYAQETIFIQSPTLNASPAISGILSAVRRGIKVILWLDLGFNDSTEGKVPFQGGTNEFVVNNLFKELKKNNDGMEHNLEVYWYTGKDQTHPLNASERQRNCHIKFMAIDNSVAIMGNGNMDTQTWFHSQEINAMIDSKEIVNEWMDALRKNQSTGVFGTVTPDGKWRGKIEKS